MFQVSFLGERGGTKTELTDPAPPGLRLPIRRELYYTNSSGGFSSRETLVDQIQVSGPAAVSVWPRYKSELTGCVLTI